MTGDFSKNKILSTFELFNFYNIKNPGYLQYREETRNYTSLGVDNIFLFLILSSGPAS